MKSSIILIVLFTATCFLDACQEKDSPDQDKQVSTAEMQMILENNNYDKDFINLVIKNKPDEKITRSQFEAEVKKNAEERDAFIKQQDEHNKELKLFQQQLDTITDFVDKYEFAKNYPQFITIGEGVTQTYLKLKAERSEEE